MTTEQVNRGNKLIEALNRLKNEKGWWEQCKDVYKVEIRTADDNYFTVNASHINSDVLKSLTLDTINKKIAEFKNEFDNL